MADNRSVGKAFDRTIREIDMAKIQTVSFRPILIDGLHPNDFFGSQRAISMIQRQGGLATNSDTSLMDGTRQGGTDSTT